MPQHAALRTAPTHNTPNSNHHASTKQRNDSGGADHLLPPCRADCQPRRCSALLWAVCPHPFCFRPCFLCGRPSSSISFCLPGPVPSLLLCPVRSRPSLLSVAATPPSGPLHAPFCSLPLSTNGPLDHLNETLWAGWCPYVNTFSRNQQTGGIQAAWPGCVWACAASSFMQVGR